MFWYFNQGDEVELMPPPMPGNDEGGGGESDSLTSEEREIFDRINKLRKNQEPPLTPLTLSPALTASAKAWADTMKRTNKFEHNKSDSYYEVISMASNASDNVQSWIDSDAHLSIILNKSLTEMGVGRKPPFAAVHIR